MGALLPAAIILVKKDGSASAVPSFSRSCVISYLMFQQKVNNVLLTDPATIDPQQRIRGQNKLFVVIRDRLQRRKFPIRVFRRKNIADLDIEPVVSPVCNEVNLCHILLSDVDGETSAQQLQEYSVLQNAGNIIVR